MDFPLIETSRLTLASLMVTDGSAVFSLFSDRRVMEYYDLDIFTREIEAQSWIAKHKARFDRNEGIRWAIRFKGQSRLIGTCGFNSWNQTLRTGEIGFEVSPECWGKGIAAEAVQAVVEWAFVAGMGKPLNRIIARTMLENDASARLLLKLGFQEKEIVRGGGHWKGAFHDLRIFALASKRD